VVQFGGKALDNPGYDLSGVLNGSEGHLVFLRKLVLRIVPKAEAVKTMMCIYNTIKDGSDTVSAIMRMA